MAVRVQQTDYHHGGGGGGACEREHHYGGGGPALWRNSDYHVYIQDWRGLSTREYQILS